MIVAVVVHKVKEILIRVLKLTIVDIHHRVFNFLLGRNGHGQHRAILDTLHLNPGNGGTLSGVVKFPLHHQVGLPFLEQAAPFSNISASNHGFLSI